MRKQLQFTLGAVFFALLLMYGGARFFRSLTLLGMESDPGWAARQTGSQVLVSQLPSNEQSSLVRGDEILAINGEPIKRVSDIANVFHRIEPEYSYRVLIRRNGFPLELVLTSQ